VKAQSPGLREKSPSDGKKLDGGAWLCGPLRPGDGNGKRRRTRQDLKRELAQGEEEFGESENVTGDPFSRKNSSFAAGLGRRMRSRSRETEGSSRRKDSCPGSWLDPPTSEGLQHIQVRGAMGKNPSRKG